MTTPAAGAPAAGAPAVGAPAAGAPAAGAPAAGAPAAGAPAAAAPWHGFTDAADVAYIANKGWSGPQDAIKSYRDAEKFIGRDPSTLLSLPRGDDPNAFLSVMDKLGRPADPAKYEFAKPKTGSLDENYMKWARGTFHELGLTAAQVSKLSAKHNEYIENTLAAREKDYRLSVEADKQALREEWRDGHERMMLSAESAVNALGLPGEAIDALEQALGYAGTYKLLADLGKKIGEDGRLAGGGNKGFSSAITPAEAKAQWEALKLDASWQAAARDPMHPGHKEAQEKQNRLFKIMFPAEK